MAIRKTTAERIEDTQVRLEHYENQMKLLLQERKQQERKERTRRLIERGAILERTGLLWGYAPRSPGLGQRAATKQLEQVRS